MVKQIKLIENVLTTVTTNVLTPIALVFEFKAKAKIEVSEGSAEIDDIELYIGDSKKDCFEIFENLSDLENATEKCREYNDDSRGCFYTSFDFVADWVPCLVDLETKQIFYIEKDKLVFCYSPKHWEKQDVIHEITDFVPSDVLQWNLEQASIEV